MTKLDTRARGLLCRPQRVGAFTSLLGLLAPLLLTAPLQAHGQDDSGYRAAVKAALVEMDLGNYVEAQAQFERAHRIAPSARTSRSLGVVAFELKHYVEAERFCQQSLDDDRRRLDDKMRAEIEALLQRTRYYLGTLRLTGAPDNASLLIDQRATPLSDDGLYRLNLGEHALEVQAAGTSPVHRRFTIRGGETEEIALRLGPLERGSAGPDLTLTTPQAMADAGDGDSVWESPWLWTAVGVVVAGAAVGTVLALSASDPAAPSTYGGSTGSAIEGP